MCGRYTQKQKAAIIEKMYGVDKVVAEISASFNVCPGQDVAAIAGGADHGLDRTIQASRLHHSGIRHCAGLPGCETGTAYTLQPRRRASGNVANASMTSGTTYPSSRRGANTGPLSIFKVFHGDSVCKTGGQSNGNCKGTPVLPIITYAFATCCKYVVRCLRLYDYGVVYG